MLPDAFIYEVGWATVTKQAENMLIQRKREQVHCTTERAEKKFWQNPVDILNIARVFNWSKWIFMVLVIFFWSIYIGEL